MDENKNPRIAVIGSGPAALGVLTALTAKLPTVRVTLFDHGRPPHVPALDAEPSATDVKARYDELYKEMEKQGVSPDEPNPKTNSISGKDSVPLPRSGSSALSRLNVIFCMVSTFAGTVPPSGKSGRYKEKMIVYHRTIAGFWQPQPAPFFDNPPASLYSI